MKCDGEYSFRVVLVVIRASGAGDGQATLDKFTSSEFCHTSSNIEASNVHSPVLMRFGALLGLLARLLQCSIIDGLPAAFCTVITLPVRFGSDSIPISHFNF